MTNGRKKDQIFSSEYKQYPVISSYAERKWVGMVSKFLNMKSCVVLILYENFFLDKEKTLDSSRKLLELLAKLIGIDNFHSLA